MNNANLSFGKKAKVHLFSLVFNFRDVLLQYTHSYISFFERIIVRRVYCPLKAMVRREEKIVKREDGEKIFLIGGSREVVQHT